ncbi:MAG: BamA/TamA family outer membrane protein [Planctomycetota bacterium]
MTPLPRTRATVAAALLLGAGGSCAAPVTRPLPQEGAPVDETVDETLEGPTEETVEDADGGLLSRIRTGKIDLSQIPGSQVLGGANRDAPSTPPDEEGGDVVLAPIPFANPTVGAGLAVAGAYLVKLDPDSPPSTIGAGGGYSENDSYAAALDFKGYFGGDRYRLFATFFDARLNFDLSSEFGPIPLRADLIGGKVEVLVRAFERVFFGPTLVSVRVNSDVRDANREGVIPEDQLAAENTALGVRALRDARDSTFYPRTGSLADAQVRAFVRDLGADFSFRTIPLSYNHYFRLGERDVLAVRAAARFAVGDVPFYGQSYLGAGPDLRGYAVGTVRGDNLLAAQAEYRRELFWRLGAVAFGGVGTVFDELSELDSAEAYPSAGFGLRLLLEKDNHVNFRVDFAWGDGQDAIYVSVGEAS